MATQIILLERVESLGEMGDVVSVKPGYARNYLLPQKKAMRASKDNIAYFEGRKKHLQTESEKLKKDAEKRAQTLEGLKVPLIRQASEGGQLYGSVTARDIATEIAKASKEKIDRTMVRLNQNFKTLGLFPVSVALHPEVKVDVIINIARSAEEAETQAKTGKALVSDERGQREPEADEAQLEDVLEEGALEARKEQAEEDAQAEQEEAAAKEGKAKKKKAKAVPEDETSEENADE